jgi:uncharacterized membrane protein YdjX (TVP38/TMEM64 family)
LTEEKYRSLEQLTGKRRAVPRFLKRLFPTVPYLLVAFVAGIIFSRFYRIGC